MMNNTVQNYLRKNTIKATPPERPLKKPEIYAKRSGKIFRSQVENSVNRRMQKKRLELSFFYLADKKIPVTALHRVAGYPTQTEFSKAVKDHFGCAPRDLRRKKNELHYAKHLHSIESESVIKQVVEKLASLGLRGMSEALPNALSDPCFEKTHQRICLMLFRLINFEQKQREADCLVQAAGFSTQKNLTTFDFSKTSLNEELIVQLHKLDFLKSKTNIVLNGGPGTGKTQLAISLGVHAIRSNGKCVKFLLASELINILASEEAQNKRNQFSDSMIGVDLIIIDELGYLPLSLSDGALLHLFFLRIKKIATILITTDLNYSNNLKIHRHNALMFSLFEELKPNCDVINV